MHSSARFRANSPKGGDAKPPVYGTHVPMTAGLPVGFHGRSSRGTWPCRPEGASPECLGTAKAKFIRLGLSETPLRKFIGARERFREPAHVQFNFALIYSAPGIHAGRSFSGVST